MTRFNIDSIQPNSPGEARLVVPWEASDDISTYLNVIKNKPGLLGAVVVEGYGEGDSASFEVWDASEAGEIGDVCLARITICQATMVDQRAVVTFPSPGVIARKGITVVISGDAKTIAGTVYYR